MTLSTTDVLAYWKADTNGSFPDAHTGGYNGTISGATYTASGKINGAYSFDNSNDMIVIGNISAFETDTISYSIWLKRDGTSVDTFFVNQAQQNSADGRSGHLCRIESDNKIGIYVCIANAFEGPIKSTNTITDTNWHHVVITKNGTTVKIYLDGSEETTSGSISSGTTDWTSSNKRTVIGNTWYISGTSLNPFGGDIDEISIWGVELSSTQVTELWNSGAGIQYPFSASGWTGSFMGVTNPASALGIDVANISTIMGV